jgi:hypothetical protein
MLAQGVGNEYLKTLQEVYLNFWRESRQSYTLCAGNKGAPELTTRSLWLLARLVIPCRYSRRVSGLHLSDAMVVLQHVRSSGIARQPGDRDGGARGRPDSHESDGKFRLGSGSVGQLSVLIKVLTMTRPCLPPGRQRSGHVGGGPSHPVLPTSTPSSTWTSRSSEALAIYIRSAATSEWRRWK